MPYSNNAENTSQANNMALPSTDEARYAALSIQVQGLDSDYKELKSIVVGLDRKLEASNVALSNKMELMVNALGAKFDASVTGIQSKLDERSRIPWQAWGVVVTVLIAIGALVYWPIRESTAQLRADHIDLANKVVYSRSYDVERATQNQRTLDIVNVVRALSKQVQITRESVARQDQTSNNLDARLDAISRRLAEHIRDVTRGDRR